MSPTTLQHFPASCFTSLSRLFLPAVFQSHHWSREHFLHFSFRSRDALLSNSPDAPVQICSLMSRPRGLLSSTRILMYIRVYVLPILHLTPLLLAVTSRFHLGASSSRTYTHTHAHTRLWIFSSRRSDCRSQRLPGGLGRGGGALSPPPLLWDYCAEFHQCVTLGYLTVLVPSRSSNCQHHRDRKPCFFFFFPFPPSNKYIIYSV